MSVLLASGRQRAGKKSRVGCGPSRNQFLAFASWNATVRGDDLPTPNMLSYGSVVTVNGGAGGGLGTAGSDPTQTFDEGILGIVYSEFDFGGDWDAGTNSFDDPPGIYPRDDFPGLVLDQNRLDPGTYLYPWARLRTCRMGTSVQGKVTFTADGKNQGPFQVPTGSNTSNPDNG